MQSSIKVRGTEKNRKSRKRTDNTVKLSTESGQAQNSEETTSEALTASELPEQPPQPDATFASGLAQVDTANAYP